MSNYEPVIKGGDWGIWRRVKKIPWNYTLAPDEKDPHFGEKLKAEGSGILNWALAGLRKYIALGYKLPPCEAVDKATALYREEMDIFGKFAAEHLEFAPQATAFGNLMYKQYKTFCTDNGFRFQNSRRFYAEFRKRYPKIAEHPSKNGAVFEGVGLLVDGTYPTPDLI
jgi:putative DNA primase/helicase